MEKHRTVVSLLLVAIGAGLLLYGLSSKADVATSSEQPEVAETSGLAVTQQQAQQEVAKDEVKPDTPAEVKKTSGGGEKAPAACPT